LYGDFSGLPPALLFAGELDPLRDDTLHIAERWMKSAPVEVYLLPSSPHGFIHFPTAFAQSVLAYSREWITARIADSSVTVNGIANHSAIRTTTP
jgi:acetyl esterase/lipase